MGAVGSFNGATAFRRWKRATTATRRPSGLLLQWGHRLSAMETANPRPAWCGPRPPSMGPPPFGDGNLDQLTPKERVGYYLQWGHRLSAMETALWSVRPRTWLALQWGHRLSAMETPAHRPPRRPGRCPFNGATAFRRWKRATPRGRCIRSSSFNGATAFRRWKRATPRGRCIRSSSFNGATAFRRWKRRPCPCGGRSSRPFNGATAFRRWKP